ncbi:uncharacterized protein LOC121428412 isoform X1 [Lytechinus variegatus]|uniref:uncharacterized protein LOC121428412 isoform X1 n=1 Tax=Lytechinus variegatus TaxID=7654 RepID=UPI001BB0EDD4|nr:uncharacterized protein LOC121428412 isoform X1 [Lytechinus variegatus]
MKSFCLLFVMIFETNLWLSSDGYFISGFNLVNGSSTHEGHIEVQVKEEIDDEDDEIKYGVLSDIGWTIDTADRVCQNVGFPNAIFAPGHSRFGKGQHSKVFEIGDPPNRVTLVCVYEGDSDVDSGESVADCSQLNIQTAGVTCNKPKCFRIPGRERGQVTIIEENEIRTNEDCLLLCQGGGTLFAAQRDEMCFCFNDSSVLDDADDGCNRPCTDNDKQLCGGGRDVFTVFNVSAGFCPEISGVNLNVYGRYRFGDIVRANCSGGKQLMGDAVLQCVGGPDVFQWNGTIPTCVDGTTIGPIVTFSPITRPLGMSTTLQPTGTRGEKVTDISPTMSTVSGMGMGARSDSKSLAVPITVSVISVVIIAVLATSIFFYFNRMRKKESDMKPEPTRRESEFNNKSYSMHKIPNNDGPSYYEVKPNTLAPYTIGTDGLINNVLYKPADDVRRDTNEHEPDKGSSQNPSQYGLIDNILYKPADNIRRDPNLQKHNQISPNDTPHYGLIDNVLYKPVENAGNTQVHNFRQSPNGNDLPPNDSEYAYPEGETSRGFHQEGEMIDNILYKPADNQTRQPDFASRKYYEIKPGFTPDGYEGADPLFSGNIVTDGPRYHDIEPQSEPTPSRTKFTGYDSVHGIDDDASEITTSDRSGQRLVVRSDDLSSASHEYVDNDGDFASKNPSTDGATSPFEKNKPFPSYATVQKKS